MQYSILCGLAMVYCGITETTTGRYLAPYVIRCQSTTSLIIHILCYHVNCLFAPYFRLFRLYPNHLFCLTQLPDPKPSSTILFLWKVSFINPWGKKIQITRFVLLTKVAKRLSSLWVVLLFQPFQKKIIERKLFL